MMKSKILTPSDGSSTQTKKLAMWNAGSGLPVIRIFHHDSDRKNIFTDLNDLSKDELTNLGNFLLEIAASWTKATT